MLVNVSEGTWSKCIINANEILITGLFFTQVTHHRLPGWEILFVCMLFVVCGGACAAAVTTCGVDHLECPRMTGSLK
jgi:hypothetical protein